MDAWQTTDDAFQEGRAAYDRGKGRFDNPYDEDDAAFAWEDGWRSGHALAEAQN